MLAALALDPDCQFGVGRIHSRNVTGSMDFEMLLEFFKALKPQVSMSIPNEPKPVQRFNSFLCDGTRLSVLLKFVLVALPLAPTGELRVGRISMRNLRMTMFLLKGEQIIVLVPPLLGLVGTKLGTAAGGRVVSVTGGSTGRERG